MGRKRCLSSLVICGFLSAVPVQLHAGTVRVYGSDDIPDPRVVAMILGRGTWQPPPRGATRGLSAAAGSEAVALSDAGRDLSEERIEVAAQEAVAAWNARFGGKSTTIAKPTQVALGAEAAVPRAAASAPAAAPSAQAAKAGAAERPPSADALAVMVAFANNSAQLAPKAARALDAVAEGMKLAGYERRILIEGHTNATGKAAYNIKLSQLRAEAVKRYLVASHGIPERALMARGYGAGRPLVAHDPYAAYNRRVQFRALDA